jgi:chromosomal replication initiation ATPase DnaA
MLSEHPIFSGKAQKDLRRKYPAFHPVMTKSAEPRKLPALRQSTGMGPTARAIILSVCDRHGVDINSLIQNCRHKRIASARREAMYELWCVEENGKPVYSMARIGRMLGGRDKDTVSEGIKTFLALRLKSQEDVDDDRLYDRP